MNDFMNNPEPSELAESIQAINEKLEKVLEKQEDTTKRLKRFAVALAEALTSMKSISSNPPKLEAPIRFRNLENGQTVIVPVKSKQETTPISIAEKKEYLRKKLRELEIQEALEKDDLSQ